MKTHRATLERFRLIEAIGKWEGGISNARLRDLTGLHTVQVSRLIASYLETNSEHFEHEPSAKRYRWKAGATSTVPLDEYLSILVALQRLGKEAAAFIHEVRVDLTEVPPPVYAILNEACASSKVVEIGYRSMTNPKGMKRVIEPHSLIHVGRRWHVRAWCRLRERFSDFNLGRIRSASLLDERAQRTAVDDEGWSQLVSIRIAPHHLLTSDQAEVVKAELLGGAAKSIVRARSCLVAYVIQELRAAIKPDEQRPPDYQIEVANSAELTPLMFSEV